MADATARFHLSLSEDMAGAQAAAGNLDAMRIAMQADVKELNALKMAMRDMQKAGMGSGDVFDSMKVNAKSLQERIGKNQASFAKLGGSFAPLAKEATKANDSFKEGADVAKAALGPMGGLFEKLNLVKGALGGVTSGQAGMAIGAAVLTVVVLATLAAVGMLLFSMSQLALEASSAAMKQTALTNSITGSATATKELQASISRVSASLPIAQSEVTKLANNLYKSGKRGAELDIALQKAALAASGLGDKASAADIEALMIQPAMQAAKLKENLTRLFAGVKVEGFLKAMRSMLSVFDESSSSAKALTALVEIILNPLFAAAETVGPFVKNIFRGMVIGALIAAIAVLKVRNAVMAMIPASVIAMVSSLGDKIDWVKVAVGVGVVAIGLLFVALAALTVLLGVVAVAMFLAFLPLMLIVGIVLAAVAVFGLLVYALVMVGSYLMNMGAQAVQAADSIISGIIGGITSGAGRVLDAMKNLASGAMNAFKSAIGYGSPAKAFIAYGKIGIAGGVEKGVDDGSGKVNAAVDNMVSIPSGASPAATKMSGAGGKVVVQLNYQGSSAGEERQTRGLLQQLCSLVEGGCAQAGIPLELEAV